LPFLISLKTNQSKPSYIDDSKDMSDTKLDNMSKSSRKIVKNNAYALYKMHRKAAVQDKLDKTYLSKQIENLSNITQTFKSRLKLSIRNLEVKDNLNKSKVGQITEKENTSSSIFLTNFNKKSFTTKRTTIGNSSIISHPNIRLSEALNLPDKKKGIQLANQLTIKSNNNIKVYCFKPTIKSTFETFGEFYLDLYKTSAYISMFKRITIDKNYKRVQNLESKVSKCIIDRSLKNSVLLPKI
jgi:hypothetical protein